jgi:uncharacterized delta-60 repeat protein
MSAGSLDTTFNNPDGYVIKQYTPGYTTLGISSAIDSTGRIVVIGSTFDNTNTPSIFITRYLVNGTLDTGFAVIIKQYTTGKSTEGRQVAIDNNDRVVVTGYTVDSTNTRGMFITRYLANGNLDTGFGDGGAIIKRYTTGKGTEANSVVIDSGDRIVVTGYTTDTTNTVSMFITRYLANGILDTSFADGGVIIKRYTTGKSTYGILVAIDSNDKFVVTGYTTDTTNTLSMFITRYLDNGILDTSFADGGVIIKKYTTGKDTYGHSLAIDSKGRIVVTGHSFDSSSTNSMFITRYLDNGILDTSFADGGVIFKQYTTGKNTWVMSVAIDSSNSVVITGYTVDTNNTTSIFITRYLDNGILDTGFGGGVIFKQYTYGMSVVIDASDRVITTGYTYYNNPKESMFITRYIGYIRVTSVEISPTNLIINTTATKQFDATILPQNATNTNVTWNSSNTNIATVSNSGLVKPIAPGTVIINVTTLDGARIATSTVTVVQDVKGIKLNISKATITVNTTKKFVATISPQNATNKNLKWNSSNTKIATVSNIGLVKAIAPGKVIIKVTTVDGNYIATSTVTLVQRVKGIKLNISKATIKINTNKQLRATLLPANATNKKVTWKSSNPKVAIVNSSGLLKGLAPGKVTITCTATDGSKKVVKSIITVTK